MIKTGDKVGHTILNLGFTQQGAAKKTTQSMGKGGRFWQGQRSGAGILRPKNPTDQKWKNEKPDKS